MAHKCAYAGCDDSPEVTRRAVSNGETYDYCEDHDPLASEHAHGFEEVDNAE